MIEGLNVSASEARKLLRDILASGVLHLSDHATPEMANSWRHRVKTNSICVVVTLGSATEATVVTAWRIRR
ncbi:MAG: hypothetical protein HYV94_12950 [Candidatus Rokubacteria bacterium]|nr:hypothetical protein [Candidatus Rokubacteria bacterium]MBI2157419.1 hypothetical protein [Candidatus Rokubacteria bacterium]MBI2492983.1 hypothetical protein [Candidatus Rokubacteria bacterium]